MEPLLKAEHMSSDESIVKCNDEFSGDDSAENASCPLPTRRKKLIKKRASWRSEEFQEYICSLNCKIARRHTERGKVMILDCKYGEDSTRSPADCPEWARTIFD